MDRDDIAEDLVDHYNKKSLVVLAEYLGLKNYESLNKPELSLLIVDNFSVSEKFQTLYNKLTKEAQITVKHLTWNGISTLRHIETLHHIKISLDDFYGNTDDPFIKQFKNYYSKEILFSGGLRELFKIHIDSETPKLQSTDFSEENIVLADNIVVENLGGIVEFINSNDILSREFPKKLLIKTLNKFASQYEIIDPIKNLRKTYILRFLSYFDPSKESLFYLLKQYKNGRLLESENIDRYLFYPYIKGLNSNRNIEIFLKRGRYSFFSEIQKLEGWISIKSLVRELSLKEDTQIFDTSYFGSLLSVKLPDEFRREFSNEITLTYKKDSEEILLLPMCRGIIFFLYSIGMADIVVNPENREYGLSELESITHFRMAKPYEAKKNEVSTLIFHKEKMIITVKGNDSSLLNFCSRIGETIGGGHFLVTFKSFFKECDSERDTTYNLDKLTTFLGDNVPELWIVFLSKLNDRINPIYNEQELIVINFPKDDTDFIDTIINNEQLRSLFQMVEGFKGAFSKSSYLKFKKIMKTEGFFIQ